MAATYDHAVVQQALASGHVVVFTEVNGLAPGNDALVKEIGAAAEVARRGPRKRPGIHCAGSAFPCYRPKQQTPQAVSRVSRATWQHEESQLTCSVSWTARAPAWANQRFVDQPATEQNS
jgi:hypothetical protein